MFLETSHGWINVDKIIRAFPVEGGICIRTEEREHIFTEEESARLIQFFKHKGIHENNTATVSTSKQKNRY